MKSELIILIWECTEQLNIINSQRRGAPGAREHIGTVGPIGGAERQVFHDQLILLFLEPLGSLGLDFGILRRCERDAPRKKHALCP